MKRLFFILFVGFYFKNIKAQNLTSAQVLSTYKNDVRLGYNRDITNFAKGLRYHSPIIKQVLGQVGFSGSTLNDSLYGDIRNEDYYGVNITTNSFKEIRLQKLVKEAQVDALASENRVIEQQALMERYQLVNSLFFTQKLIFEKKKLDSLTQKRHEILSKMIEKGEDVRVKDVMDAERDKNVIELLIVDLENDLKTKLNQLTVLTNNPNMGFDATGLSFISIDKIQEIIELAMNYNNHPSIDLKKAKTLLSASQFNYENAQNRQIFQSIRLAYQNPLYLEKPKKLNPLNNFNFRIGLTIPLPTNNSYKRSDALLELREAQNETEITKSMLKKNADLQYLKLQNLFTKYQSAKEKIDKSLLNKLLANDKILAQMPALDIADGHIMQQKLKINLIEIEQEITSEYLKMLDLSGLVSSKPLKNYLSNDLEALK